MTFKMKYSLDKKMEFNWFWDELIRVLVKHPKSDNCVLDLLVRQIQSIFFDTGKPFEAYE